MRFSRLLLIGLDPLIDLIAVGAVVGDGSLHKAQRYLQVARSLGSIAAALAPGMCSPYSDGREVKTVPTLGATVPVVTS